MGMTHGSHALIDEQSIGCFVVDPMWEKQCHKPPIWDWFIDVYSNYNNGDLGDGLLMFIIVLPTLCFFLAP
jgi:hypothetical protein